MKGAELPLLTWSDRQTDMKVIKRFVQHIANTANLKTTYLDPDRFSGIENQFTIHRPTLICNRLTLKGGENASFQVNCTQKCRGSKLWTGGKGKVGEEEIQTE